MPSALPADPAAAVPPGAWRRLLLVGLGTLVVPLDTAVNVAFPAITAAFGLELAMIQWVVIAYVLTYGSLMLAIGRAGDVYGHLLVFRAGLACSVVAYLLCAWAPGYGWLLACRVLQGIGAALVISCGAALATGLFPEAMRGRILGWYALFFAAGSVIGPSLGGVLVEFWGWPAVFWFRAPVALLALLLLRGAGGPVPSARGGFDAPGAALLAMTIGALLLSINQARHLASGGWQALPLAAMALAGMAGLFAWSRRGGRRPVLAWRHFRSADFALANLATALVNLAAFSVLLFVPYYLTRIAALPTAVAGLVLAAGPLGTMLASPLAGWLLGAAMPAPRVAWLGTALVGAGLLLVAGWGVAAPIGGLAASLLVHGVGLGLLTVSTTDMVTGAMPREDRGVAGSLAMLMRTFGVVLAASLLTLFFAVQEGAARAGGAAPAEAFLAAFGAVFMLAAAIPTLMLLLVAVLRVLERIAGRRRRPEA